MKPNQKNFFSLVEFKKKKKKLYERRNAITSPCLCFFKSSKIGNLQIIYYDDVLGVSSQIDHFHFDWIYCSENSIRFA